MNLRKVKKWNLFTLLFLAFLFALFVNSCEDFQQFPTTPTPAEQPAPEPATRSAAVNSADKAVLAVYEHLLGQAESSAAKSYLADFYTVCDNWTAETTRFQDGTSLWAVTVDETAAPSWQWPDIWRQASWNVYRDGRVVPSSQYEGNALRIEAKLQELSAPAKSG